MTSVVASIASATLPSRLVAAPPTAVPAPHPDAKLIELGAEFEEALTQSNVATTDYRARRAAFEQFVATRSPNALLWVWDTDKGMPFDRSQRRVHGEFYSAADVAYMASRRWDDTRRYTSGITGKRVQRRSDQIVAAYHRWQPVCDAHAADLGLTSDLDRRIERLDERVCDIQEEIDQIPAQTLDGLAIKARSILQHLDAGLDQEPALVALANAIVEIARAKADG